MEVIILRLKLSGVLALGIFLICVCLMVLLWHLIDISKRIAVKEDATGSVVTRSYPVSRGLIPPPPPF